MSESVNYHQKQADALKCATDALKRIDAEYYCDNIPNETTAKIMAMIASATLKDIERILK